MSTVTLHIGDVFDQLAKIPDGSIDLIVTSPPFLALRSYLPDDHPDKALEIGSESGPAAFLDTMLALSAEWGRVLAPHGSLCVELGDTYSGSGGAGGDYNADGLRDGQQKFTQSNRRDKVPVPRQNGGGPRRPRGCRVVAARRHHDQGGGGSRTAGRRVRVHRLLPAGQGVPGQGTAPAGR